MDWSAFGLSRDPFQRGPELDDACLPNTMAALLSELLSSLRSPQGVSVLVADAGSGKSVAAAAFARRVGGVAHVAQLLHPTSSVSAIARDALAQFDATDFDFTLEEDWAAALRARVERCAKAGRATVIIIDDAHRLSPQTLEDLAGLFGDDEAMRLHVVLFGRPRLLDRMHAGAERALDAHLLQICRLEPLGVRESVRYLERRLAICGGELAALYDDEAIDEIVQRAEGRILRLEEVAAEALRRATRRGQARASVQDVVATARRAVTDEEEVMAVHQQPLRFALTDEEADAEGAVWDDPGNEDRTVEWGDEDGDEDEEWEADEAEDTDEPALTWDTSPHHLDEQDEDEEVDGDLEEESDGLAGAAGRGQAPARRRLVGPAVLSIGACLALVWAANHVPGPSSGARHGRDAMLFAKPLSSEPTQIMRIATTVEAADADAQVVAWRAQPPRPVQAAAEVPQAATMAGGAPASRAEKGKPRAKDAAATAATAEVMGPPLPTASEGGEDGGAVEADGGAVAANRAAALEKAPGTAAPSAVKTASVTTPGKSADKPVVASRRGGGPVFTVQLGAFKARRNAEQLVTKLRGKSTHILQEGGLYRVISGSFASKQDAIVHEASLKRAGYTTYVRTAVF